MTVATALVTGNEVSPHLAELAVKQALARAGLTRAEGVVLLLSQHFTRHADSAVLAAARAAGCMQIVGMTAPGLITEQGWSLDQVGAAALVLGDEIGLTPIHDGQGHAITFCATPTLPKDWLASPAHIGLLHDGSAVWQQGRVQDDGRCHFGFHCVSARPLVATGLKCIGPLQTVSTTRGLDLLRVDTLSAVESLQRALPADWKKRSPLPVHHLASIPEGDLERPAIPLLAANADGSITLAQMPEPGQQFCWALRQPLAAEAELRTLLQDTPAPEFALMFSCIGRGPLFYGNDDHDLAVWRERFPDVPLLGAYGSAQIAPARKNGSEQWQNSVVLALCARK